MVSGLAQSERGRAVAVIGIGDRITFRPIPRVTRKPATRVVAGLWHGHPEVMLGGIPKFVVFLPYVTRVVKKPE